MAFNAIETHKTHWFGLIVAVKMFLVQMIYDCLVLLSENSDRIEILSYDCPLSTPTEIQSLKSKTFQIFSALLKKWLRAVTLPHYSITSFLHLICKLIISIWTISKVFQAISSQQLQNDSPFILDRPTEISIVKHFAIWKKNRHE